MDLWALDGDAEELYEKMSEEELNFCIAVNQNFIVDRQIDVVAYACWTFFKKSGSVEHLDQVIQQSREWIEVNPSSHAQYKLRTLGLDCLTLLRRQILLEDERTILKCMSNPHAFASLIVNAGAYSRKQAAKFEQFGNLKHLDEAISILERIASIFDDNPPTELMGDLAKLLCSKFERTGDENDCDHALAVTKLAENRTPPDHPDYRIFVTCHAMLLSCRFRHRGSIDDLNRAIEATNGLLETTSGDSSDRIRHLHNLGVDLYMRFERLRLTADLDRAVQVTRDALDIASYKYPPARVEVSKSLASLLENLWTLTKSVDDLNQAVELATFVIDATPIDDPDYARCSNNLGNILYSRYQQTDSLLDLDKAIAAAHSSVSKIPRDHPSHALYQYNFAIKVGERFTRLGLMEDLVSGIQAAKSAVEFTPEDHPKRAAYLLLLGNLYQDRYNKLGAADDQDGQLSSYIAGWRCLAAPPLERLKLARVAANILSSRNDWEKASQIFEEATQLIPTITPRSFDHKDARRLLGSIFGFPSEACATALQAGRDPGYALQLLEIGSGVLGGFLIDMREDISDLRLERPDLADEFTQIRDELDAAHNDGVSSPSADTWTGSSWQSQAKHRVDVESKFNETIAKIRSQTGFSSFLRSPGVEQLMKAACRGPLIVLNVCRLRSDAVLVRHDSIQVLELPGVNVDDIITITTRISFKFHLPPLLEWLWSHICSPCLEALGFKDAISDGEETWPHVWWVPTGILSRLPLHAAGVYSAVSENRVLDRVVSSFAPSIRALLYGRNKPSAKPTEQGSHNRAVMVSMHETPHKTRLPFAGREVGMLESLCPSLNLSVEKPSPNRASILNSLQGCQLFHFAGHGWSDPEDPFRSSLLLDDWETNPLTVEDLRNCQLHMNPPFLAYLSACSTGPNQAAEAVELAYEGINIVGASQLAGFRHVIGTLWEVSDGCCVDVARVFYGTMQGRLEDEAVSRSLHRAIRTVRDKSLKEESGERDAKLLSPGGQPNSTAEWHWVPYFHCGA